MSDKIPTEVRARKDTRANPHAEHFPDQARDMVSFTFTCPECLRQETSPQLGPFPSLCGAQLDIREDA